MTGHTYNYTCNTQQYDCNEMQSLLSLKLCAYSTAMLQG